MSEKRQKVISLVFAAVVIAMVVVCIVFKRDTLKEPEEETIPKNVKIEHFVEESPNVESNSVEKNKNKPEVIAIFNITVPEPIPEGYYITMGCNLTDWFPLYCDWPVEKVDDTHYKCVMNLSERLANYYPDIESIKKDGKISIGLQYKWTLQREGLDQENMWSMVEISKANHDIQNRIVILGEGENVFNDEIGRFKGENEVINNEPTVVGKLVYETVKSDGLLQDKERLLRVWLPEGYDANDTEKSYPVYYMHDAQNLFDRCTSFAGEWMVDETITECIQDGYEGCIVVGIDSVDSRRMDELSPTFTDKSGIGEDYARFIVEKVKPFIDGKYNTRPERGFTAIGGSSMGGAMSLYMCLEYPDIFGKAICFSTALVYYPDDLLIDFMKGKHFENRNELPAICIYSGGVGVNSGMGNDERSLTRYVEFLKNNLTQSGYPKEKIYAFTDEMAEHSESAWSKYFPKAFRWLEGLE